MTTSVTDTNDYRGFCRQAAADPAVFANFRRHQQLVHTLEHVSKDQGWKYIEEILADSNSILCLMDRFKDNDLCGNPVTCNYANFGNIAPTTLRYIKVLNDLLTLFGSLNSFSIAEIGIGYGGQACIIGCAENPWSYLMIDLPEVLELASKYMDKVAADLRYRFLKMDDLHKEYYDLVISNYAFSELNREIQDKYLDRVILKSGRGYITYNQITPSAFNSYQAIELLGIIPGSHILPEVPLTHPLNCIIVWGDKQ